MSKRNKKNDFADRQKQSLEAKRKFLNGREEPAEAALTEDKAVNKSEQEAIVNPPKDSSLPETETSNFLMQEKRASSVQPDTKTASKSQTVASVKNSVVQKIEESETANLLLEGFQTAINRIIDIAVKSATDQVQEKIKDLENSFLTKTTEELKTQKEQVERYNAQLNEDLDEMKEVLNLKKRTIEKKESARLKAEKELDEKKAEIARLQDKVFNYEEENDIFYNEQYQKAINDRDKYREELSKKVDELEDYKQRFPEEYFKELRENKRALLLEKKDLLLELQKSQDKQDEYDRAYVIYKNLRVQNQKLQERIEQITEEISKSGARKFSDLEIVNGETRNNGGETFENLKKLANYIHDYGIKKGINGTPLYYNIQTIRAFIASLAASKDKSRLIILQGPSGIGKSSLPQLFAKATGCECEIIPVQPSWRDNKELLGYDNDFTKVFKSTAFTKVLYKASLNPNKIFLVVLDEMNLARVEYYFADFLSTLETEPDEKGFWHIDLAEASPESLPEGLVSNNGIAQLKIGKNVWFIGTANEDESTNTITDKVYDRAQVMTMEKNGVEMCIDNELSEDMFLSAGNFLNILPIPASFPKIFLKLDTFFKDHSWMDMTFGNRMENQIKKWIASMNNAGSEEIEATDYFLANKFLRKFEGCYEDAYKYALLDLLSVFTTSYILCVKKIVKILHKNFNCDQNGQPIIIDGNDA